MAIAMISSEEKRSVYGVSRQYMLSKTCGAITKT
jgi:hypothetical protein